MRTKSKLMTITYITFWVRCDEKKPVIVHYSKYIYMLNTYTV